MAMLSSCCHGCDEFLKRATMVAMSPPPPPPSCFFLGSSSSSSSSRSQMLSFSSNSDAVASMLGVWARLRGPFTPTQWMELEHQALIYKHIIANAPVPARLLIPIRRSLHPWSNLASSSLGWGAFHLGCTDAEPGRCRRTDGKKWRCSRDAVLDQKYCERHINRGRHRSRKHVEGRKAMPAIAEPVLVAPGGGSSGSHAVHTMARKMPVKDLADNVTPCPTQLHRMLPDKRNVVDQVQDSTTFPMSNSMSRKSKDIGVFEETSSQIDYVAASRGSLMNSTQTENLSSVPQSTLNEQPQLNSIHHFFDEELQSYMTQLSVPTPMDSSNFSPPHASPNHEKLTQSPLKSPHDHDQAHIAPGAGSSYSSDEGNKARASWVPVSCETLVDGPLGEVFKSKSCPSASWNVLTDGWTVNSRLHSPTGVLQTTTNFSSMSSSTVSSPTSLVNPQTAPTL